MTYEFEKEERNTERKDDLWDSEDYKVILEFSV